MIIPRLDEHTCNMIRELCQANGIALKRIADESGLPISKIARLFIEVFTDICDKTDRDVLKKWGRLW